MLTFQDGPYKPVEIRDGEHIQPQRIAVVDVFVVVHRPAEQDASPVGEAPELVGIGKLLAQLLCLRYAAPEPAIAALDLVQDGGQCTGLGILPKAKAIFAGRFHDALFSGGGDVLHFCCLPACGLIFAALAGGLVSCCEYKIAHKYNNVNSFFGFFKIFFCPMVYSLLQSIYCVYFIRTQDIVVYSWAGHGAPLGDYGG